ncbi:MAG: hypothetical protein EAZ07_03810 [Cytophagales bacterium]|nr:MAG: hypothetical protein EAZ07_03810 [Cytophagales bacterium]
MNMESFIAELIIKHFVQYKEDFLNSCKNAKIRFEEREWDNDPATTALRLKLYDYYIENLSQEVKRHIGLPSLSYWKEIKIAFKNSLNKFEFPEHARSFFNSLTRMFYYLEYYERDIYFELEEDTKRIVGLKNFSINKNLKDSAHFFSKINWNVKHQNLYYDTEYLIQALAGNKNSDFKINLEFYPELFYRNKKAYLLGFLYRKHSNTKQTRSEKSV